ncbi:hypothetical protein SNEBB_007767 [Seison nebaliae]|nr:hypothetical protein SNEBB_007767 [Seison nebaliae]
MSNNGIDDQVLERYEMNKRLGRGAYGIVWKAIDKRTQGTVALKKIFDAFRNKTDAQRTYREVWFLCRFNSHPNVIRLLDIMKAQNNKDLYLVFDFMETDLHRLIKRKNVLHDMHKRYIMYQLFKSTYYLHSGDVIHRDQKPCNILLNKQCVLKLADFGLARSVNETAETNPVPYTEYIATRWYRAPEILLASKTYTKGIDMWSIGCILGELYLNEPIFQGTNTLNQLEKILVYMPKPSSEDIESLQTNYMEFLRNQPSKEFYRKRLEDLVPNMPKDAMDLFINLLKINPKKRLTALECMHHIYVARFYNKNDENVLDEPVTPDLNDNTQLSIDEYRQRIYLMCNQLRESSRTEKLHRRSKSRNQLDENSKRYSNSQVAKSAVSYHRNYGKEGKNYEKDDHRNESNDRDNSKKKRNSRLHISESTNSLLHYGGGNNNEGRHRLKSSTTHQYGNQQYLNDSDETLKSDQDNLLSSAFLQPVSNQRSHTQQNNNSNNNSSNYYYPSSSSHHQLQQPSQHRVQYQYNPNRIVSNYISQNETETSKLRRSQSFSTRNTRQYNDQHRHYAGHQHYAHPTNPSKLSAYNRIKDKSSAPLQRTSEQRYLRSYHRSSGNYGHSANPQPGYGVQTVSFGQKNSRRNSTSDNHYGKDDNHRSLSRTLPHDYYNDNHVNNNENQYRYTTNHYEKTSNNSVNQLPNGVNYYHHPIKRDHSSKRLYKQNSTPPSTTTTATTNSINYPSLNSYYYQQSQNEPNYDSATQYYRTTPSRLLNTNNSNNNNTNKNRTSLSSLNKTTDNRNNYSSKTHSNSNNNNNNNNNVVTFSKTFDVINPKNGNDNSYNLVNSSSSNQWHPNGKTRHHLLSGSPRNRRSSKNTPKSSNRQNS